MSEIRKCLEMIASEPGVINPHAINIFLAEPMKTKKGNLVSDQKKLAKDVWIWQRFRLSQGIKELQLTTDKKIKLLVERGNRRRELREAAKAIEFRMRRCNAFQSDRVRELERV